MANTGKFFETEIIYDLDNREIKSLDPNYFYLLERLYGPVDKQKMVYCRHADPLIKPDVIITYEGKEKSISLKTGTACEVHRENIRNFIPFLRSLGISERTLKTIVLFQYGDHTFDGSGKERMTTGETFDWLEDRIKEANEELNDNKEIINAVLDRAIFQGIDPSARHADYLYHGSRVDGILVSQNQIYKYVNKKRFDFVAHLHIGPLILRSHARYAHKKVEREESRHMLTLYWPNFRVDLEYINSRFGL